MNDIIYQDITEANFVAFLKELELKIMDGWAISKSNPGDVIGLWGGTYTVTLERSNDTVQRLRTNVGSVQDQTPKQSKADSLAKARQARWGKSDGK
jgi:hypothetical protein